jgi:tRNA-(ms[2]io[6]A)-hydroxylase
MDISSIKNFLGCETPLAWCVAAEQNQELLLIDHAHCEKKAASTAVTMLFRYVTQTDLTYHLSRLAREELRHFEQVISLLQKRNIPYTHLPPAPYALGLRQTAITHEPARLVDLLIISAFIEARSCERFASLIPYLDADLAKFYRGLLAAEARHYQLYLKLARQYATFDIEPRLQHFREAEKNLILSPDPVFRFHSGIPQAPAVVNDEPL